MLGMFAASEAERSLRKPMTASPNTLLARVDLVEVAADMSLESGSFNLDGTHSSFLPGQRMAEIAGSRAFSPKLTLKGTG